MRNNINKLLDSDVSIYRISKDTGVPESTIREYRQNRDKVNRMGLSIAEKLSEYYKGMNM